MERMPLTVVFNYRSPFCALVVDRLFTLESQYAVAVDWRIAREVPRPSSLEITVDNPRFHYNRQDCERRARWLGLPWAPPDWRLGDVFAASRLGQWILVNRRDRFRAFTERASRAYWCDGRNLSDPEVVDAIGGEAGLDGPTLREAHEAQPAIDGILDETGRWCEETGVLGVPYFRIEDQSFWGSDRLAALERHLADLRIGPFPVVLDEGLIFHRDPLATLPVIGSESRVATNRLLWVRRGQALEGQPTDWVCSAYDPLNATAPQFPQIVEDGGCLLCPRATVGLHYVVGLVVIVGRQPGMDTTSETVPVFGVAVGIAVVRDEADAGTPPKEAFVESLAISSVKPHPLVSWPLGGSISVTVNGDHISEMKLTESDSRVEDIIQMVACSHPLQAGDCIFITTPKSLGAVREDRTIRAAINGLGSVEAKIERHAPRFEGDSVHRPFGNFGSSACLSKSSVR